jgi:hypothetical protein
MEKKYPIGDGYPHTPEMDLILRIVKQWGNAVEMPNMEGWLKEYAAQQQPPITDADVKAFADKSGFIKDYKQYKENLRFLGGPKEWTYEKVASMSKIEMLETIKGFNEVITFFDNVLYAYEEGAKDWEERCLKAEASTRESAVWVKASERLPENPGRKNEVIIRGKNDLGYLWVTTGFKNFSGTPQMYYELGNKSYLSNDDIEWLDEAPAKDAGEGVGDFLEWLYQNDITRRTNGMWYKWNKGLAREDCFAVDMEQILNIYKLSK